MHTSTHARNGDFICRYCGAQYFVKGTWWVGTGTKYDPPSTVALPTGSFVTHFGKQVHYDGAKFEDTVLLIVGDGPGTSTLAEEK